MEILYFSSGILTVALAYAVVGVFKLKQRVEFLEIEKDQLERQCIKRMLMPEDISKAVLFFASDQSSGCTAQNYVIDGGIVN